MMRFDGALLDKEVKVVANGRTYEGTVWDVRVNEIVWVETDEDIFPINVKDIVSLEETKLTFTEKALAEVEEYLTKININYSIFSDRNLDGGRDYAVEIEGFDYIVSLYIQEGRFSLETVHRNRWKKHDTVDNPYRENALGKATANRREYKTLTGVKNYIDRYVFC